MKYQVYIKRYLSKWKVIFIDSKRKKCAATFETSLFCYDDVERIILNNHRLQLVAEPPIA